MIDMVMGESRLPARGKESDAADTTERQAREARLDAERYARRGNKAMSAISMQAAQDLEAALAARRPSVTKGRTDDAH